MDLSNRTLTMLIAPSVMGKSAVIRAATKQDERFKRVKSFTTRKPREDDEAGLYFYLTREELAQKKAAGEVVTSVVFPTTGVTYGTLLESFEGQFCLQDTLANSVDMYRNLSFADTKSIALISPVGQWKDRFKKRYPEQTAEATQRLDEAVFSLAWCIYDPQVSWLINEGSLEDVSSQLINMVTGADGHAKGADMARDVLAAIKAGIY